MAMYCPFCQIQLVGRIGRYCASCGKDIQFLASALADGRAQLTDEMREAALFQKHRSKGQTTEDAKKPEPGDLIEIFRGLFQHWAVYIGDCHVVHLVTTGKSSSGTSSALSECFAGGEIKKEKFEDVISNDKWNISNVYDKNLTPRPKQEIVKAALSMVGKAVKYNITHWNCEHFATMCRYGKALSFQVDEAKKKVVEVSGKGAFAVLEALSASAASLSNSHSSAGKRNTRGNGNESGEEMKPLVTPAVDQPAQPNP